MRGDPTGPRRDTALVWGAITEICLAGVVFAWLISPGAAKRAAFGLSGSVALVVLALIVTGVATAAAVRARRQEQPSRGARWALVVPMAIAAGGLLTLAYWDFFAPSELGNPGVGILLALSVVGMFMLVVQLGRVSLR